MKTHFALRKFISCTMLLACSAAFSACSLNRQAKKQEEAPVKPDVGATLRQPYPAYDYAAAAPPVQSSGRSITDSGLNGQPSFESRYRGETFQAPQGAPANVAQQPQYYPPTGIQRTSAEMPLPSQPVSAPMSAPTQPISYAFPRGQAMPPCGPGCQGPDSICMHGDSFGHCQSCRAAGVPFQAGPCWPEDEYLYDGGDRRIRAQIDGNFGVHGVDIEDTIGHYDTLDGKRIVTPSNRVCVYSPRFAAVRKVAGLNEEVLGRQIAGMDADIKLQNQQQNGMPTGVVQPLALRGNVGGKSANALEDAIGGIELANTLRPEMFVEEFKAFEDLGIIRYGTYDQGEKARLASSLLNAVTWTDNQAVQIMLEGRKASEVSEGDTPYEFVWSEIPGEPRLRVIKVADKGDAKTGEIVEFTLRFDNVGTQKMGNVTIIDNLTPRLQYVEGSAQCDIEAQFMTQLNEAGSQVLRWEISSPLDKAEGGIIRFQCRVQ